MSCNPVNAIEKSMRGEAPLVDRAVVIEIDGWRLKLRSNSAPLLARMEAYFHSVLAASAEAEPDLEMLAIQTNHSLSGQVAELAGKDYLDWRREAGKTGRKDAYIDLLDESGEARRVVYKVRTGMVFLQQAAQPMAAGPCLENDNQVINFINAQYMNWLQQKGCVICHAAALVQGEQAVAMAGFSGGGKSTLMLHMMEQEGSHFMSNDRLFLCESDSSEGIQAAGVPKMPRINPGTILHSPRLRPLLSEQRITELEAMPQAELWDLEEKYDAMVDELYGPDRILYRAPLQALLILHWQRDSAAPVALNKVELDQRRDLLPAVMKSPGPFYQKANGEFQRDLTPLDEPSYVNALRGVDVYEVTGGVDFQALLALLALRNTA